jgi:hypothetical protein
MTSSEQQFDLSVEGLDEAELIGETAPTVAPSSDLTYSIRLSAPSGTIPKGSTVIFFTATAQNDASLSIRTESRFMAPYE